MQIDFKIDNIKLDQDLPNLNVNVWKIPLDSARRRGHTEIID